MLIEWVNSRRKISAYIHKNYRSIIEFIPTLR